MAKDVVMPALGMAQETGVLLQWLKAPGEPVTKGEPLMEVETDKATVEVEAPASGVLANVTAKPGEAIPVGQVIAVILAPGEVAGEQPLKEATPTSLAVETQKQEALDQMAATVTASPLAARLAAEHNIDLAQVKSQQGGRVQKADVLAYLQLQGEKQGAGNGRTLASPKARRLAREHQLDLATLSGSGPDGAVLADDVLAAAEAAKVKAIPIPTPALTPVTTEAAPPPVSRIWQVMAQRLTESWQTIPHFYLVAEANATALSQWRERALPRGTEKISFTDLLVKLVAVALQKHPRLNARWENNTIILNEAVNIGLAVAVEEGLLVPVIHQADQLGLNALAARRQELVAKAHAGKLAPADMSDGTFTISNLGMYGIDAFSAIVNPPQAAILALGRIAERVVAVNGQPTVQPMLTMTLSCDHRAVDGARGAEFLQTLVRFIEDPLAVME